MFLPPKIRSYIVLIPLGHFLNAEVNSAINTRSGMSLDAAKNSYVYKG